MFTACFTKIDNLEQKLCIIENVGVKFLGQLSIPPKSVLWLIIETMTVYWKGCFIIHDDILNMFGLKWNKSKRTVGK